MPVLNIDGVGSVEVGHEFGRLTAEQQNATVSEIIAQIGASGRTTGPNPPPAAPPGPDQALTDAYAEEGRQALAQSGVRPAGLPGEIVERGAILPFGADAQGKVSLALPEFLEGPRRTIMDLLEGKRTVKEVSGKEIFELGALFAGGGGASNTGAGIARASGERAATQAAERAAGPAVTQTAKLATELAAEAAPAVTPAAPAAAAAPAARGGLHSTPETLALRGAAKEKFKVLDESNVVVSPSSFGPLTKQIFSEASVKGLDETITPMSNAAIKRLQQLADEPVTLQTLNTMREVAGAAAGAKLPKDRMIAELVIDKLDNFVGNLTAKDLAMGTQAEAAAVAKALTSARATWSEMSKLEMVARLVQRAEDAVANRPSLGIENSLRTEFTALMKNDAAMRKLNPQEQAAVRQITKGATKATMRGIGKLAPTGPVSGIFTGGLVTALGAKIGLDPLAAAVVLGPPVAGVTFGARKLAAVLTQSSVKNLENVIKAGPNPIAERAIANGQGVFERLAGHINSGIQAQSVQPQQPRRR